MNKFFELKDRLKLLAKEITEKKLKMKDHQRGHHGDQGGFLNEVWKRKYEFRHKHIAYCVMRGTPRDMIEKPGDKNQPSEDFIKEIIIECTPQVEVPLEKDVCLSTK